MNAWGEEDPSPERQGSTSRRRRLRGGHLVAIGLLCVALWPAASLAGATGLGPMLAVLGVMLVLLGAVGWWLERLGIFDDEPDNPADSVRITDVAHLAKRIRRD